MVTVASQCSPSKQSSAAFRSTHLSTFDDYLTFILVDSLYFWIDVRKVHSGRRPPRGLPTAVISGLLRRHLSDPSVSSLLREFLALPTIKSYIAGHTGTPRLIHEFESHARRYLSMYLPSVPFELGTTDRYRAVSRRSEACVIARAVIESGTMIRHLAGKMVAISSHDRTALSRDFSIIYSHRLGESCLMLGPCRFVNHDCDPNCRFIAQGGNGVVAVMSTRKINLGEEITVSYAENYFGKKNRECMCATCEKKGRGFFGAPKSSMSSASSDTKVFSDNDTSTDEDFDSQSENEGEGVKTHRTRAHKRRRLEQLEMKHPDSISSTNERSENINQTTATNSLASHSEHAQQDDESRRRSSRIRERVSISVKRDYEDVTRAVGCKTRVKTKADKRSAKSRVKIENVDAQPRRSRVQHYSRSTLRQPSNNSRNRAPKSRSSLKSLPTPPASVSGTNSDATSDSFSDIESQDSLPFSNFRSTQRGKLLFNAFWGSSDYSVDAADSDKTPTNQIEVNWEGVTPPFETRRCANESCRARFVLASRSSKKNRGSLEKLDSICFNYVQKYETSHQSLVCLRCNRHAGIYGTKWPQIIQGKATRGGSCMGSDDEEDQDTKERGNDRLSPEEIKEAEFSVMLQDFV
ncbi:hypothetical protein BZA70DRAFT_22406 [Myxozyma melibiosi]|uniref:Histone-lysine N-methyltransferase SET9 n=1 Tax=Myxozyma melibiosi TaxID=54550 RepID=A0ABR1FCX8_9ASCO